MKARSNTIGRRNAFDVFKFDRKTGTARSGFTSIAPFVKFVLLSSVSNFSIQSSFFIPFVDNEVEKGVFLIKTDLHGKIGFSRIIPFQEINGSCFQSKIQNFILEIKKKVLPTTV